MLHPDPMGSPFADAAVSLLRKLTFKGKWTLAFCNIQIPPVHYHNIKFIPFFPPPGLNVCSHDRPSEPWYKCEEHRKSPMITRCPLSWAVTHCTLSGMETSRDIWSLQSDHVPTLKLPILCQRGQSTDNRETNYWKKYMCISKRSSEAFRNGNIRHKICVNKFPAHFSPKTLPLQLWALRKSEWGHHLVTSTEAAFTLPHLEKFACQLIVTDQCKNWYFTTESGKTIISKVDYRPQMLQHSIFFCFLNWFMLAIFTPD